MGHYIKKCSKCGIVLEQCRCISPNKPIIYTICDKCKLLQAEEEELKLVESIRQKEYESLDFIKLLKSYAGVDFNTTSKKKFDMTKRQTIVLANYIELLKKTIAEGKDESKVLETEKDEKPIP